MTISKVARIKPSPWLWVALGTPHTLHIFPATWPSYYGINPGLTVKSLMEKVNKVPWVIGKFQMDISRQGEVLFGQFFFQEVGLEELYQMRCGTGRWDFPLGRYGRKSEKWFFGHNF